MTHVDGRIAQAISRFRLMVDFVTDLVFSDDGAATGEGVGNAKIDASVGWHFGFYSRPKDGARGIVVKADGQGNNSILVAFRDVQYEMTLQKGEVGAQNAFSSYWLLNKDGVLELNGTTYTAPKWDDFISALKTYVTAVNTVLASNCVNGAPLTAQAAQAAAEALFVTNLSGSLYKSSKVKLG